MFFFITVFVVVSVYILVWFIFYFLVQRDGDGYIFWTWLSWTSPGHSTIGGGQGYDDSVPGEVTITIPSGDRTT